MRPCFTQRWAFPYVPHSFEGPQCCAVSCLASLHALCLYYLAFIFAFLINDYLVLIIAVQSWRLAFRLGLPAATRLDLVDWNALTALSTALVTLLSWLLADVMLKLLAVCVNSYQPLLQCHQHAVSGQSKQESMTTKSDTPHLTCSLLDTELFK